MECLQLSVKIIRVLLQPDADIFVWKDSAEVNRTGIKILEDHNMKKFLAMLLAVLTVCSFAACAAKPAENDTADVEIADALTLLNTVWASYTDDEKFPAAG